VASLTEEAAPRSAHEVASPISAVTSAGTVLKSDEADFQTKVDWKFWLATPGLIQTASVA